MANKIKVMEWYTYKTSYYAFPGLVFFVFHNFLKEFLVYMLKWENWYIILKRLQ
ncbi:hypothetical protein L3i20_v228110 [Paenibacillus sp. L3-i20]|nr:hypothetical protein L3i20_v228110 [Paenibacillus sp. L3-i20]